MTIGSCSTRFDQTCSIVLTKLGETDIRASSCRDSICGITSFVNSESQLTGKEQREDLLSILPHSKRPLRNGRSYSFYSSPRTSYINRIEYHSRSYLHSACPARVSSSGHRGNGFLLSRRLFRNSHEKIHRIINSVPSTFISSRSFDDVALRALSHLSSLFSLFKLLCLIILYPIARGCHYLSVLADRENLIRAASTGRSAFILCQAGASACCYFLPPPSLSFLASRFRSMHDVMTKQKFTREQIAERIVEHGDLLVIYSNKIYRLNAWIKHHPGGEMVILHMIGKVK